MWLRQNLQVDALALKDMNLHAAIIADENCARRGPDGFSVWKIGENDGKEEISGHAIEAEGKKSRFPSYHFLIKCFIPLGVICDSLLRAHGQSYLNNASSSNSIERNSHSNKITRSLRRRWTAGWRKKPRSGALTT